MIFGLIRVSRCLTEEILNCSKCSFTFLWISTYSVLGECEAVISVYFYLWSLPDESLQWHWPWRKGHQRNKPPYEILLKNSIKEHLYHWENEEHISKLWAAYKETFPVSCDTRVIWLFFLGGCGVCVCGGFCHWTLPFLLLLIWDHFKIIL